MKHYRDKLSRDQETLLVSSLVIVFIVSLVFIYQGVSVWEKESIQVLEDERALFLRVKKVVESSPNNSSSDLTAENFGSKISTYARNNGVIIDRIQPIEEDILSITIKNVDFINLLNLIKDLKEVELVSISKVSLRRNISEGKHKGIRAQMVISL